MRRSSNSRPLSDRDVFERYKDESAGCELAFELGLTWGRRGELLRWPAGSIYEPAADSHHLWSIGRRPDFKSNLIALARKPHFLFHFGCHAEQIPLRLLCLCAKAKKAARLGDPSEFSLVELDTAAGCCVRGWIECAAMSAGWEWVEKYRAELLARLRAS